MSYFIKNLVQTEYEKKFDGVEAFLVVDTTGLNGVDNNILRGELKKKQIRMTIVKNSLMRRAVENLDMTEARSIFQTGPCAVVYGGDSVVDAAKEIVDLSKKYKSIKLKGAFVEGAVMDSDGVVALSKMPTRAELQGQVAQTILSPGSNITGALLGPGGMIAGCVKSLIEKLEKDAA